MRYRLPRAAILRASWAPRQVRQHAMRFGPDRAQRLIAFIPRDPQPGPWVFFLFGGNWSSGSPRTWAFVGNWFARHGIPAVLGGYRLAPAHHFPDALDDTLAGFDFSLRHAEELGISGRPAVLAGASSGGHLAALAAIRLARDATREGDAYSGSRAAGLLTVNAALNPDAARTPKGIAIVETFAGHPRPWLDLDPIAWVSAEPFSAAAFPSTLLIHGECDELVSPSDAKHFADAINALMPERATVATPSWTSHAELTRLFLDRDPSLTRVVVEWLRTLGA